MRPHEQLARAGSAGRASVNVETTLVDDEGRPVAPGQVGEIVHRSPHAALGYFNDEEKTAEAFRGGWFRWIEAVTAVIVARPGVELVAEQVHAHVRERLAGYKRPKFVAFADALPKNPSGKILKRELRERYAGLAGAD